ncbi:hypothetical protein CERZMDRAFT_85404 [Cercospora zeae-maydis SCOH1-5]|uniref:Elongin-A n=1 Tax=Cercospora zeae-maydis SCOH1-5 TaxID=717836 RepID=A0A6A6FCS8_9PEZI|nr:hypothetical protein CERZMDRAFT_85404 [Cercospora zeae-maydis SCOH1-5]
MAIRCAQRNIESIDDLADMPFDMARPILKRVHNPQQLLEIEKNSPQLAEHTGEFWQAMIKRDMPNLTEENMLYPKNPSSWHKVYRKLMRAENAREAEQEEQLRLTLLGSKVERENKKAVIVDKVMHHAREGPSVFVDGTRKKGTSGWERNPNIAVHKTKSGTDAIAAIRNRSAANSKQMSLGRTFKSNAHAENSIRASRQITEAPASMLREVNQRGKMEIAPRELLPHQKDLLQEQRRANGNFKVHAPGRARVAKFAAAHRNQNEAVVRQAREVNEAKLRALTQSANAAARARKSSSAKFDFEATPQAASPEPQKQTARSHASSPAASPPAQAVSPPKPASPAPVVVKKRPAPAGSIFMKTTKKSRH